MSFNDLYKKTLRELVMEKRYRGYYKTPRQLQHTLHSYPHLSSGAISMYLDLAAMAFWDERNPGYQRTPLTVQEYVAHTNIGSRVSIKKWLKQLWIVNLIEITPDKYIHICNFEEVFIKSGSQSLSQSENFKQDLENLFPLLSKDDAPP